MSKTGVRVPFQAPWVKSPNQCSIEVLPTFVHLTQHVTNVGTGSVHRCLSMQCAQPTLSNHVRSSRCRSKNFASLNVCLPNGKAMMMTARLCDQTPRMTVMSRYPNVCSAQAGEAIGKLTMYRGSCHICPSDAACHECGNRFRTPLCQLAMHAVHSFKSCSII